MFDFSLSLKILMNSWSEYILLEWCFLSRQQLDLPMSCHVILKTVKGAKSEVKFLWLYFLLEKPSADDLAI